MTSTFIQLRRLVRGFCQKTAQQQGRTLQFLRSQAVRFSQKFARSGNEQDWRCYWGFFRLMALLQHLQGVGYGKK